MEVKDRNEKFRQFLSMKEARFNHDAFRKLFEVEYEGVGLVKVMRGDGESRQCTIKKLCMLTRVEFEKTFGQTIEYLKARVFKVNNASCFAIDIDEQNLTTNVIKEFSGESFKAFLKGMPAQMIEYYECILDSYIVKQNTKESKIFTENGFKCLNMFEGFKYALTDEEELKAAYKKHKDNIAFVESHVRDVLCSKSLPIFNVVMKSIYKIVQGEKLTVCVVLKGLQGVGKSIICELIVNTIGDNLSFHLTEENELFGNFNGHLVGKVFTWIDDVAFSRGNKEDFGNKMKTRITDSMIGYRDLYKTARQLENINSWFLCCNPEKAPDFNESVNKDARMRYIICDIDDTKKSEEYMIRLNKLIRGGDESFFKAFYYHCMKQDLSNFNEQVEAKKIPVTDNKIKDIQRTLPQHVKFLKENLHDTEMFGKPVTKKVMYEKFTEWHGHLQHKSKPQIKNDFIDAIMKYKFVKELAQAKINGVPYKKCLMLDRAALICDFKDCNFIVENDEVENVLLEKKYDSHTVNETVLELREKDEEIMELKRRLSMYESGKKVEPVVEAQVPMEEYVKMLTLLKEIRHAREQRHEKLFKPVKTRKAPVKTMKAATFDDAMKNVFEIFH